MYYNVNKTLSHNAFINMVIGIRGYGKTYGLKRKAIKDFLEKGSEFIYLRRYDTELQSVQANLFDDIILNDDTFGAEVQYRKGGYYSINDEVAGYPIALSRSNYYKSASFPKVNLIIFDEFIVDTTKNMRYLKNEVRTLLDFIETIFRSRDNGKVFMLANSLSFVNPYTLYWDLKLPKNKKWSKAVDGLVLCEIVGDDEFVDRKKDTIFGKLNAGTEFERYSVMNEFILDNDTFVERKSPNAKYLFTFQFRDEKFGVWIDYAQGLYYVTESVDPSCKLVYSTTMEDHSPNALLFKKANKGLFSKLIDGYKLGITRFESIKVKNIVSELIRWSL